MTDTELLPDFEAWLRTVCFQKPTPDAYDLAKCAWVEARQDRWIPVSESFDKWEEWLLFWDGHGAEVDAVLDESNIAREGYTHWQPITPPKEA